MSDNMIRDNVAIKVAKAIAADDNFPMSAESPSITVHNTELLEAIKQLSPICHSLTLDKIADEYEWIVHFEYK